jgi:hypothetical protein
MLNKGDTIKCKDPDELINLMHQLEAEGYKTDFVFEKDGERGFWLEIEEVPKCEA